MDSIRQPVPSIVFQADQQKITIQNAEKTGLKDFSKKISKSVPAPGDSPPNKLNFVERLMGTVWLKVKDANEDKYHYVKVNSSVFKNILNIKNDDIKEELSKHTDKNKSKALTKALASLVESRLNFDATLESASKKIPQGDVKNPKLYKKAFELLEHASQLAMDGSQKAKLLAQYEELGKNYPPAANKAGEIYLSKVPHDEVDNEDAIKAFDSFKQAAQAGDPKAMANLALCYARRIIGSEKFSQDSFRIRIGLNWAEDAIMKGNNKEAFYAAGLLYQQGAKGSKDMNYIIGRNNQANEFFTKAANKGDPRAALELIKSYVNGIPNVPETKNINVATDLNILLQGSQAPENIKKQARDIINSIVS